MMKSCVEQQAIHWTALHADLTSIFSSPLDLMRSVETAQETKSDLDWIISQLLLPTLSTSPLTASESMLSPYKQNVKISNAKSYYLFQVFI